jgi:hypothetical protein
LDEASSSCCIAAGCGCNRLVESRSETAAHYQSSVGPLASRIRSLPGVDSVNIRRLLLLCQICCFVVGWDSAEHPKKLQQSIATMTVTMAMFAAQSFDDLFVVKGSRLVLAPRTPVPLESAPKFETVPPLPRNFQLEM